MRSICVQAGLQRQRGDVAFFGRHAGGGAKESQFEHSAIMHWISPANATPFPLAQLIVGSGRHIKTDIPDQK